MTAKRIGKWFLRLWFATILLQVVADAMYETTLPIPSSLIFWGIFTPVFYDWARSRNLAQDRALFLQELADLLRLGVSLPDALNKMVELRQSSFGHKYSEFTRTLAKVNEKVQKGDLFSVALQGVADIPSLWTDFLPLTEDPDLLADTLEDFALNEGPRLAFPMISVLRLQILVPMIVGIGVFLATYILPTFIELFHGMNLALPLPTRILATLSHRNSSILLVPIGILTLMVFASVVNPRIRVWLWRLAYYLPVLRKMVALHSQAKTYQALASGLRAGAPLADCLQQASRVVCVKRYSQLLMKLSYDGTVSVSEGLEGSPELFGPQFRWLIQQGEQLETLPEALQTATEVALAELDLLCKKLVVNVDTIILCVIGFAVFSAVIGLWLPLYQMIGNLGWV